MRPTIWATLLAVCLSTGVLHAQERSRAPAWQSTGNGLLWSDEVFVHGNTKEQARQAARAQAHERVVAWLKQQDPSLDWVPAVRDLDAWVGLEETVGEEPEFVSPEVITQYPARVRVEIRNEHLKRIRARAEEERDRLRREVVEARHILSAKVLAALVALLAAVAGYFRLEELTRGYYTGVLRALLLLCVGVIGAGLWLIL